MESHHLQLTNGHEKHEFETFENNLEAYRPCNTYDCHGPLCNSPVKSDSPHANGEANELPNEGILQKGDSGKGPSFVTPSPTSGKHDQVFPWFRSQSEPGQKFTTHTEADQQHCKTTGSSLKVDSKESSADSKRGGLRKSDSGQGPSISATPSPYCDDGEVFFPHMENEKLKPSNCNAFCDRSAVSRNVLKSIEKELSQLKRENEMLKQRLNENASASEAFDDLQWRIKDLKQRLESSEKTQKTREAENKQLTEELKKQKERQQIQEKVYQKQISALEDEIQAYKFVNERLQQRQANNDTDELNITNMPNIRPRQSAASLNRPDDRNDAEGDETTHPKQVQSSPTRAPLVSQHHIEDSDDDDSVDGNTERKQYMVPVSTGASSEQNSIQRNLAGSNNHVFRERSNGAAAMLPNIQNGTANLNQLVTRNHSCADNGNDVGLGNSIEFKH